MEGATVPGGWVGQQQAKVRGGVIRERNGKFTAGRAHVSSAESERIVRISVVPHCSQP